MLNSEFKARCLAHFSRIYGDENSEELLGRLEHLLRKYELNVRKEPDRVKKDLWTHRDQILITYADMVQADIHETESHLEMLHRFLNEHLNGLISSVHLLPFFPSSSDDGFSVIDYREVDPQAGKWEDIEKLGGDFRLMADLVMNHTSQHSHWFQGFLEDTSPFDRYFIEVDRDADLSGITRPRSSPVATSFQGAGGERLVWTTFSDDQVDVNFANPDVLFEYIDIFLFYVSRGIRVVRLDAVAFIWKEIGTSSIHLPQTHEIIKLIRTLVDFFMPEVTLITETNVPHKENISYFGEGDEAHMVYQFSLPPLLLHAILTENATYLSEWAASLNPLPEGCTYLNFTSSHDGIGVRPLEGLVPDREFYQLVSGMEERGGFVSFREKPDKSRSPYELNITYFDAFKSRNGQPDLQFKRYFCSQVLMASLQGVPGIYLHNLTGTANNLSGVQLTGRFRSINRKKWLYDEIDELIRDPQSGTFRVFHWYRNLLRMRSRHPAFHPMGSQKVYDAGRELFCIERTDPYNRETMLVIANVTGRVREVRVSESVLPLDSGRSFRDELSGEIRVDQGVIRLNPYDVLWIPL